MKTKDMLSTEAQQLAEAISHQAITFELAVYATRTI